MDTVVTSPAGHECKIEIDDDALTVTRLDAGIYVKRMRGASDESPEVAIPGFLDYLDGCNPPRVAD